jgi:hypothetical protein
MTVEVAGLFEAFSVGHAPPPALNEAQEALFRAFQSNLLSLISHELKTPLMGILNALQLLADADGEAGGALSTEELIAMARRNAQRLNRSLSALLDLAAVESGTFHARLKEVHLGRVVRTRVHAQEPEMREEGLRLVLPSDAGEETFAPVLADPQKLGRAIELCLDAAIPRAERGSELKVRISSSAFELTFTLKPGFEVLWRKAWSEAQVGFQSGVSAPGSAFRGTMQSEQAFLTRMEEGLGSEFLLIHEIMRLHDGRFEAEFDPALERREITLRLTVPELSSEAGLLAVLSSRAYQASMELGSVALALAEVPAGIAPEVFRLQVKKTLFRASDAVYALPEVRRIALVMDDCRPEDAPRLLARIEKSLGRPLRHGIATCPKDGFEPGQLIELAGRRLDAAR